MANDKLIYASDARKAILKADPKLAYVIDNVPAVDAVEVLHGRWVSRIHKNILGDYFRFHCSECDEDKPNSIHINYCHNCGAKMEAK